MKKIFVNLNYFFVVYEDGTITNDFRSDVRVEPDDKDGLKYTIKSPNIGDLKIISTEVGNENGLLYTEETFKSFYTANTGAIIVPQEYGIEASLGNISGTEPFYKFGRNGDLDPGTGPEDIWVSGGLYTGFPSVFDEFEVVSDNASDNETGSGARMVLVTGLLNSDFEQMPDIPVFLNGTTPVSIGGLIYSRGNRMVVVTAGSNNQNAGNITLRYKNTPSQIFAVIAPGINQTQVFAVTVPKGKTLVIPRFIIQMARANGSAGSANITVRAKPVLSNVFNAVRNAEITDSQSYQYMSPPAFIVPEMTDIKATVESVSDNNTVVVGEANGFLVDN